MWIEKNMQHPEFENQIKRNNQLFIPAVRLKVIILLFASFFIIVSLNSCKLLRRDKKSQVEKKQAKANKEALAEYEKAKKELHKRQNKQTKKMMKRTGKKAAKFNTKFRRRGINKTKCD